MGIDVSSLRGRRVTDRRNRASIGDLFERHTWSRPDAVAVLAGPDACEDPSHGRLTYGGADTLANQIAHGLISAGLRNGDVAVLVCDNSVEALISKIAMAKAGVVVAPLNPNLAQDLIAEILERIGAKAAIVDAEYLPRLACTLAAAVVPVLAAIGVGGTRAEGTPTMAEFMSGMPATEPDTEIHGDDIWQLLFTSGSTAAPKAAMHSHHNTYYTALAWTQTMSLGVPHEHDTVFCSFLPIVFHTADALSYGTWLVGGTVLLGRRPDPKALARAITEHGVTMLWAGLPQFLASLVTQFEADPTTSAKSLQSVTYGWAPLEAPIFDGVQRAAGHRVRVQSIIGMTEVVVSHRFWLDEHEELYRRTTPHDNYVGLPNPLLAARILDADDNTRPIEQGLTGEAVYRSPAMTSGYYRDPQATAVAMRGEWFHTGDLFGYGESGQRMMIDRLKDVVKTGGENVSSIRVEAVLAKHQGVARAAVVGLPHPRWGEAVTAAVIPAPGATITPEDLIDHCKAHLAPYEVPKAVIVVDDLPTSIGGKLQKHNIRTLLASFNPYPSQEG